MKKLNVFIGILVLAFAGYTLIYNMPNHGEHLYTSEINWTCEHEGKQLNIVGDVNKVERLANIAPGIKYYWLKDGAKVYYNGTVGDAPAPMIPHKELCEHYP